MTERLSNQNHNDSRLRGSLYDSLAEQRLNGSLYSSQKNPSGRLRGSLYESGFRHGRHSETWELPFGPEPTSYGDIEKDGFQAWNSNHVSSQDAFAINRENRRFAVCDGMGGYGADKRGTAFFAKYLADYVTIAGIDSVVTPEGLGRVCQEAEEEFQRQEGRRFDRPRFAGSLIGTVASTLTYAEARGDGTTRIVTIGDSPAFILDELGQIVAQYGEDAQSGATDRPLAFKIGLDGNGRPLSLGSGTALDGRHVTDIIVNTPEHGVIAIATDYFSETAPSDILGQDLHVSSDAYASRVQSHGKSDDATIIVIDPSRL